MNKIAQKIALLVPCYNESERINLVAFKKFISAHRSLINFYFIDDGSIDETAKIINDHFLNFDNCYLIALEKNKGKGNALRIGFLKNEISEHAYAAFIDADMDIPLEQILKLYEELETSNSKIAISNRGFFNEFNFSRLRSYMSLVMVHLANRLIGYDTYIKDTQCGCKMFRIEIVELCFKEPFVSDWLFDIEIFIRFKRSFDNSRKLISEVPLNINKNISKSNSKLLSSHRILKQLYKIKKTYR